MISNRSSERQAQSITVMVVDDQVMMQELMKEYVSSAEDIDVVGVANNGRDGVQKALALEPDVVLMDIEMPEMDGMTATQMLANRKSTAKVLVVSSCYDDRYLAQSLRNGAMGYLLKTTAPEELVAAIRGVYAGNLQFGSGILQQKLSSMTPAGKVTTKRSTPQQRSTPRRKVSSSPQSGKTTKHSNTTTGSFSSVRHLETNRQDASRVTIDIGTDAGSNGKTKRMKSFEARIAESMENLAIEMSQIRAGYWVLRTEIQSQRRWLVRLSVGLVMSVAVSCLLLFI